MSIVNDPNLKFYPTSYVAEGEANTYRLLNVGGNWIASIHLNGEMSVAQQEEFMTQMVEGAR